MEKNKKALQKQAKLFKIQIIKTTSFSNKKAYLI